MGRGSVSLLKLGNESSTKRRVEIRHEHDIHWIFKMVECICWMTIWIDLASVWVSSPFSPPERPWLNMSNKQLPSSSSALRSSLSIHSSTLNASGHASPHCFFKFRSGYTQPQRECTPPHGLNGLKNKRLQELKELNVQKLDITTTRPQEKQVPIYALKPSLLRDTRFMDHREKP